MLLGIDAIIRRIPADSGGMCTIVQVFSVENSTNSAFILSKRVETGIPVSKDYYHSIHLLTSWTKKGTYDPIT